MRVNSLYSSEKNTTLANPFTSKNVKFTGCGDEKTKKAHNAFQVEK